MQCVRERTIKQNKSEAITINLKAAVKKNTPFFSVFFVCECETSHTHTSFWSNDFFLLFFFAFVYRFNYISFNCYLFYFICLLYVYKYLFKKPTLASIDALQVARLSPVRSAHAFTMALAHGSLDADDCHQVCASFFVPIVVWACWIVLTRGVFFLNLILSFVIVKTWHLGTQIYAMEDRLHYEAYV